MIISTPDSVSLKAETYRSLFNVEVHRVLLNVEVHRVLLNIEQFQNVLCQVKKTSRRDLSKLKTPVVTGKFSDLPLL